MFINFDYKTLDKLSKSIIEEFVSATTMKWEDCPNVTNKKGLKAEDAPWSIFIKFESQTDSSQDLICSGTSRRLQVYFRSISPHFFD